VKNQQTRSHGEELELVTFIESFRAKESVQKLRKKIISPV